MKTIARSAVETDDARPKSDIAWAACCVTPVFQPAIPTGKSALQTQGSWVELATTMGPARPQPSPPSHHSACFWSLTKTLCCLLLAWLISGVAPARAQPVAGPRVLKAFSINNGVPTNRVTLGDIIVVEVGGMRELPRAVANDKAKIILVLNEIPLKGTCLDASVLTNKSLARFRFNLIRAETCQAEWAQLFGRPTPSRFVRTNMTVTLQLGDDDRLDRDPGPDTTLDVVVIRPWALAGWTLFFVIYLCLLWWLTNSKGMLRDSGPQPVSGEKTFCLAQVQVAFWFSLVMPAFAFLWLMTGGNLDTLNSSALTLIGIGAGTALGAKVQDDHKKQSEAAALERRQRELEALSQRTNDQANELARIHQNLDAAPVACVSDGFLADILEDGTGISFHRVQMAVWTVVLGTIFAAEVWCKLAMPDFNSTLLALMGISSGTYLGFMLTEPHSIAQSTTTAAKQS